MENSITAEERKVTGTKACNMLREEGKMPAVIYSEGKEAEMITVSTKEFERVWKIVGESTIFDITGLGKDKSVIVQDVALDPLYDTPLHADFYAVATDRVMNVEVPLTFVGVSPAEKGLGGTLIKVVHALSIESLPKDLPSEIEIDVSSLETFADQILVKDIPLPSGVKATIDQDEVVALVQEPQAEEEVQASEGDADEIANVEVESKGKEDTAEEEGSEEK